MIKPGQEVEFTLKMFPGKTFKSTVDEIASMTTQGQLQPSGVVMAAPGVDQSAVPVGVRLRIDESAGLDVTRWCSGNSSCLHR